MKTIMLTVACVILTLLFCAGLFKPMLHLRHMIPAVIVGQDSWRQEWDSARKSADEFARQNGGAREILGEDNLMTGPTFHVVLKSGEIYRVWPNGKTEKLKKEVK